MHFNPIILVNTKKLPPSESVPSARYKPRRFAFRFIYILVLRGGGGRGGGGGGGVEGGVEKKME